MTALRLIQLEDGMGDHVVDTALLNEFRARYTDLERRSVELVNGENKDSFLLSRLGEDLDTYSLALHEVSLKIYY